MKILVLGPDDGWHANQLRQAARCAGDSIEFALYESMASIVGRHASHRGECFAGDLQSFDGVLTRTMPMGSLEQITFRLSVLHTLQERGLQIINPPRALELAIDKYATTARLSRLGLPVPRTSVSQSRADAMRAFDQLGPSVVVKPMFGGEGRGVMRVDSAELAWTTFTTLEQLGAVIYQQEYIPCGGQDLRLLVIGQSVWAVQRTNPHDWRTNVSRGSQTLQVPVTDEMRQVAMTICESMQLQIAGIDLIQDADGNTYVLEANGVPGWKGAQGVIHENLAERIVGCFHESSVKAKLVS